MTSLYIVFTSASDSPGDGNATSAFNYGVSINTTTGQLHSMGTCPTTGFINFYSGVSFPAILPNVTENVKTLYIQSGDLMSFSYPEGYVVDKNDNQVGLSFGVCETSELGNFLHPDGSNGGVSYSIVPNDPSVMPYKVYISTG